MINMIRADFYRLIRSKGFYIALLLMLLLIGVSIYGVQPGYIGMAGSVGEMSYESAAAVQNELNAMSYEERNELSLSQFREVMLKIKGYKLDRDMLATNMNLYYLFIFFAVIILTADFSGSSIKNTLSSAISRNKYYFAKLVFISLCCIVLFFLNTYIVYFANIVFNGKNLASSLETVTIISLLQIPSMLALASILTGIGFMVKRTAIFNTVTIPLILVFQMVLSFAAAIFKIKDEYLYYEFQLMIGKLANNPSGSFILHSYLVCIAVIIIFNLLGYLSFKKAEIR